MKRGLEKTAVRKEDVQRNETRHLPFPSESSDCEPSVCILRYCVDG